MLWIKIGTHIIDHDRFLAAGAIARDLFEWGMLYAGKHESDGALPLVAVLSSAWGAGGKQNAKVAAKLVEVGLWVETDTGFTILRWAEQGNQTKAQIDADRAAARERISKRRSENVQANTRRTTMDVPTSTSTSFSESRSREPEQAEIASGPPAWFASALEVIAMNTGVTLPTGEAWLRYSGHRAAPGSKAISQPDAQYWLTTVMVPEHREQLRRVARDRDRDAKFDRDKRFAKEGPPKPPPPTKAQSEAFAEELASRVRASRAVGGGQ